MLTGAKLAASDCFDGLAAVRYRMARLMVESGVSDVPRQAMQGVMDNVNRSQRGPANCWCLFVQLLLRRQLHRRASALCTYTTKSGFHRNPLALPVPSVQKQSCFGVLHHPLQPLVQPHPRHRTARHDVPFVRSDAVESQSL